MYTTVLDMYKTAIKNEEIELKKLKRQDDNDKACSVCENMIKI